MWWNTNDSIKNCPLNNGYLFSISNKQNVSNGIQLFFGYRNDGIWYRNTVNNKLIEWIKIG